MQKLKLVYLKEWNFIIIKKTLYVARLKILYHVSSLYNPLRGLAVVDNKVVLYSFQSQQRISHDWFHFPDLSHAFSSLSHHKRFHNPRGLLLPFKMNNWENFASLLGCIDVILKDSRKSLVDEIYSLECDLDARLSFLLVGNSKKWTKKDVRW